MKARLPPRQLLKGQQGEDEEQEQGRQLRGGTSVIHAEPDPENASGERTNAEILHRAEIGELQATVRELRERLQAEAVR